MTTKCIIFDCDGTLVDSEGITNQVIAEMAGELGIEMTGDEASATFGGKTLDGVVYKMKELSGKELPDDWLPRLVQMVNDSWESKLKPVKGVKEILERIEIPICVASNGEPTHVRHSLRLTKLYDFFGDKILIEGKIVIVHGIFCSLVNSLIFWYNSFFSFLDAPSICWNNVDRWEGYCCSKART